MGRERDGSSLKQFNADKLLGTAPADIVKILVPGGNIGLFVDNRTLQEYWPKIGEWIVRVSQA